MNVKELIKALPFEFERAFFAKINKKLNFFPTSEPFLSGDTFRKMANVIFDGNSRAKASDIKPNDIIFVFIDLLPFFQKEILPKINVPFTLITHKGDITTTNEFIEIAENPYLKHWYAQNCDFSHPKITPIPIGLEDLRLHNNGNVKDFLKLQKIQKKKQNKIAKIVIALNLSTNPDKRFSCYRAFWRKENAYFINSFISSRLYRKEILPFMFIASPEGNGLDCHRTWEAIYLGIVPLVNDNYMNRRFLEMKLPIIIVTDWNEFAKKTPQELTNLYDKTIKEGDTKAAYAEYWKGIIK